MARTDITRQKIKSKISAIKKLNDNPKSLVDNVFDVYGDKLESSDGVVKKNLNSFTSRVKGKGDNKKDIFGEVLDLAEGFLGTEKEDPVNPSKKPIIKSKLLSYSKQSTLKTIQESKQIVINNIKKSFFEGQGGCDSDTVVGSFPLTLSPKEFDFINMLKIDPSSTSGKIMYESTTNLGLGDVKFNRELYDTFDSGSYPFTTKDGNTLFTLGWDAGTQLYSITGLNSSLKITDFIDQYYNTIEYSNTDDVLKNAMLMTLQGDGSESRSFKDGMNNLNRMCSKLFSICGKSSSSQPLLNNAANQVDEDEADIQNYFDFDDVEGIDLDEEDLRNRRVLKFRDCNDFETPINPNHIEDFAYFLGGKTIDENIQNTLNKTSSDTYEQSGGSISFDGFQLSLTGQYIKQIPRAIISTVLSPKMMFPIAVSYKLLKNENLSAKDLLRKLSQLFYNMVRELYWIFIKNFWLFVKRDLLVFIRETARRIMGEKFRKIKDIILTLINFLRRALETGIHSCTDIFNAILKTIDLSLNRRVNIPIPGLLLLMSKRLPGFSASRGYMDAIERMEAAGINTGTIYGEENKLLSLIKSSHDSIAKELGNAKVRAVIDGGPIPAGPGGAFIPIGTMIVSGIIE